MISRVGIRGDAGKVGATTKELGSLSRPADLQTLAGLDGSVSGAESGDAAVFGGFDGICSLSIAELCCIALSLRPFDCVRSIIIMRTVS